MLYGTAFMSSWWILGSGIMHEAFTWWIFNLPSLSCLNYWVHHTFLSKEELFTPDPSLSWTLEMPVYESSSATFQVRPVVKFKGYKLFGWEMNQIQHLVIGQCVWNPIQRWSWDFLLNSNYDKAESLNNTKEILNILTSVEVKEWQGSVRWNKKPY